MLVKTFTNKRRSWLKLHKFEFFVSISQKVMAAIRNIIRLPLVFPGPSGDQSN